MVSNIAAARLNRRRLVRVAEQPEPDVAELKPGKERGRAQKERGRVRRERGRVHRERDRADRALPAQNHSRRAPTVPRLLTKRQYRRVVELTRSGTSKDTSLILPEMELATCGKVVDLRGNEALFQLQAR